MQIHILDLTVSIVILSILIIELRKYKFSYYDIFPFFGIFSSILFIFFGLFDVMDFFVLIKDLFTSKINL